MTRAGVACRHGLLAAAFVLAAGAAPARAENRILAQSFVDVFTDSAGRSVKEDPALWWNRLSLSTNVNLNDRLAFEFGGYAGFTAPSTLHGLISAPGGHTVAPRFADITALNLRARWDRLDLFAGKAGLNLGVADLYSPLATLEPVNLGDPLHNFDMGLWQAGADFYLGDSSLMVRVIPFDERSRLPVSRSRWTGPTGDLAIIDFDRIPPGLPPLKSLRITDRFRSPTPANWGYLAAYKTSGEGFDASGGAYYGPGLYPVLKIDAAPSGKVVVRKERADTLMGFGTVAVTGARWKAYGELLVQHAPNDDDDDFVQGVAGLKYDSWALAEALHAETVAFTLEYTGDHAFDHMRSGPRRLSSKVTRPYRNSVLTQIDLAATSHLDLYTKASVNANTHDSAVWLGARYRWTDDISLHVQGFVFQGDRDTPFGRWKANDGMFFGIDYVL